MSDLVRACWRPFPNKLGKGVILDTGIITRKPEYVKVILVLVQYKDLTPKYSVRLSCQADECRHDVLLRAQGPGPGF